MRRSRPPPAGDRATQQTRRSRPPPAGDRATQHMRRFSSAALSPERGAELPSQLIDGAARPTREFLAPLALGLEAAVADRLAPGGDHLANGVRVSRITAVGFDRGDDVGDDAQERAQRHAGTDAVLAAVPGLVEDALDLLEVVEEEALRVVEEAVAFTAAERLHGREDVA